MSKFRYKSPEHEKWAPAIEGQIRDCVMAHPRWFAFNSAKDQQHMIRSLAKRIIGEIVACRNVSHDA